jgi:HK97 gp10 family phage protein
MAADVRVVVDSGAVRGYVRDPSVGRMLVAAAAPGVGQARGRAPHLTGAGAGSIHAEPVLEAAEWTVHVGWDAGHDYMRFHELGTRFMPARPFLVPSFEGA